MGCCVSTQNEQRRHHPDGEAPPSPLQEETVKEVLLETAVIPKAARGDESSKPQPVENQKKYLKAEIALARVIENPHRQMPSEEKEVAVSEVLEMCSFSEGVSDMTMPEKNDDAGGDEVNHRPTRKVKDRGGDRRMVPSKRLTAPSPEKRVSAAPLRTVRGQKRNVETGKERRREGGAQRSVSKKVENGGGGGGGDNYGREAVDDAVSGDPEDESLENPVVSLECFIFL